MFKNNFFPEKSYRLWDNVETYGTAGQATDGKIKRIARWITKAKDTHTHTHTQNT